MTPHPEPQPGPEPLPALTAIKVARRSFVFFGMFAIAGCATGRTGDLPGPIWPDLETECKVPPAPPVISNVTPTVTPLEPAMEGVLPRSAWARGAPVCSAMNPMLPVKYITVHHDGLPRPLTSTDETVSKARIETIRNGHRGKGWGDIGYHFVIDRNGRVWEGRAINWQGAHVEKCNEGNIGICCMGNFDEQAPSSAQLAGLERQLKVLMVMYGVPKSRVYTHQEWPSAKTACPGKSMQAKVLALRKGLRVA